MKKWLESKESLFLVAIVLLALILRIVYMLVSDNYFCGDSGARLYMSYEWANEPSMFEGYDWLPLPFYLVGAAIALFHDTLWVPRVVSVLFGAFSVIPFYFLVKRIFETPTAAVSALIFALLPAHILLSVITSSEAIFVFFLLLSALYLFKFLQFRTPRSFNLSVFFISCINLIRFEGWLFTLLFIAVLFFNGVPLKKIIRFGLFVSVVPLFVLLRSFLSTGDPLRGLVYSDYEVRESIRIAGANIADRSRQIQMAFMSFTLLFIPLGLAVSLNNKRRFFYAVLFLIPLLSVLSKIYGLTLHPQFRYFISAAVLGIPFFVEGVIVLFSKILRVKSEVKVIVLSTIICLGCCFFRYKMVLYEPLIFENNGRFFSGFRQSAEWARVNLPVCRLYVDDDNFTVGTWMAYAHKLQHEDKRSPDGLSLADFRTAFLRPNSYYHFAAPYYAFPHTDLVKAKVVGFFKGQYWTGEKFSEDSLYHTLVAADVSHLVLFNKGALAMRLKFEKENEVWRGLKFRRVYDFKGYRIYAVGH